MASVTCSTSTARSAPIGSMKTPSASSTVCSRGRRRRFRTSGPTTVGPVTTTSAPKRVASAHGQASHRRAAAVAPTNVMTAPVVTRRRMTRSSRRSRDRSRLSAPSNRIMATAKSIRTKRPSPSAAGRTHPMPSGPSAAPAPSRRTIAGIRTSLATHWTDTPATSATATTRAAFASVTTLPGVLPRTIRRTTTWRSRTHRCPVRGCVALLMSAFDPPQA